MGNEAIRNDRERRLVRYHAGAFRDRAGYRRAGIAEGHAPRLIADEAPALGEPDG